MVIDKLSREDKVSLAESLKESRGWQMFSESVKKLLEVNSDKTARAWSVNNGGQAAYCDGFRIALESVLAYPDKTISYNKNLINKVKADIEEVIGIGGY